jgi:hypothetical protein
MKIKYTFLELIMLAAFWLVSGAAFLSLIWFFTTVFLPDNMQQSIAYWALWPLGLAAIGFVIVALILAIKDHLPDIAAGALWLISAIFYVCLIIIVIRFLF